MSVNPARGTSGAQIPIFTSAGRSGFGPTLTLGYDSGAGNGPFGLGWALDTPAISRKTDKGLPRYTDEDTFLLAGVEDLIPMAAVGEVQQFRPRTDAAFNRIEKHRSDDGDFWRVVSRDNITSIFGTPVADPAGPGRIFQWLLDEVHDDRGNIARYTYATENLAGVSATGAWEQHRLGQPQPQKYLKSIHYGNQTPGVDDFLFSVIFDYGGVDQETWPVREDPFSVYRAGFEVRTWRLCRKVQMFHHFPADDLGLGPLPRLVRSTDLEYEHDPAGTRLVAATQTGYVWDPANEVYRSESMPPLEFEYTRSKPDDVVRVVDSGSVANLPAGVDSAAYLWVDLDGEGLTGALTQQGNGWFFKRNLGAAKLGALEHLFTQPTIGADGSPLALVDIGGDGSRALVRHGPALSGYQERTVNGEWGPFTAYTATPVLDFADPSLRHIDLDGDGLADLLVAEGNEFRWHPSLGREGYGGQFRSIVEDVDNGGPALLHSGAAEAVLLADMSGDGLADLVRVRNGEVSYWPNLGYGRFGTSVTMAYAPVFDHPDLFDPGRLRLADIDGSGVTDLLYIGRGEVRFWSNNSGNFWGTQRALAATPDTDRSESIEVIDLLGTGTSCLVWSSSKPAECGFPLRYVDLSRAVSDWLPADDVGWAGHKPGLMCGMRNNLGGLTRLTYAPSTRFYLADRAAGRPWITRLPFPVHVVGRVETYDEVSKTRLVSEYRYRHGFYDGAEREFRGFGMVEQTDAETFPGELGAGLFDKPASTEWHRPPSRTRTWYHTGCFVNANAVSGHLRGEYYDGDLEALPLPDSELPATLTAAEARQARRALRGQVMRVEVYADDGSDAAPHPYSVTETRYRVLMDHPAHGDRPAVFRSHPLETVTHSYDRNPADPRVGHQLTIEVDEFNTVLQSVAVGYPRRAPQLPEQAQTLVTWTISEVKHTDSPAVLRLATPLATRICEVTGLPGPAATRWSWQEMADALPGLTEISYEEPPTADVPQRRLVEHMRVDYWSDDLGAPLPFGDVGVRALPHQTYKIAFTMGLLVQVYGDRVDAEMLTGGGYLLADGVWWAPSGVQVFDASAFFLPRELISPFGNRSSVDYDAYHLLPKAAHASDQAPFHLLTTRIAHDYRLLTPREITEPNGNRSRAAFDALGRVTATWSKGKEGSVDGDPDELPGATFEYRLWNWKNKLGPVCALAEVREEHGVVSGPFQRARAYSDGSGRVVLTKAQAEPGLAWTLDANGDAFQVNTSPDVRWVGNGRTVFDNKGQPVKQYEPYFSVTDAYEDEAALAEQGVTPVLHYDPVGRLIRTEHPDGTLSRVVFDPWRSETWDAGDTILESRWYSDRGSPLPTDPEPGAGEPGRWAAWSAVKHAGTPSVTHVDSLGRAVRAIADNGTAGKYTTTTVLDIEGNTRAVIDARGVTVMAQRNDLAGRTLHTNSPDAGERWTLPDVTGSPIRGWDGLGRSFQYHYDMLRRPVARSVDGLVTDLTVYGEGHPNALDRNLLGRAFVALDGSGMTTMMRHDFKGNVLATRRRLAQVFLTAPNWSAMIGELADTVEAAAGPMLENEFFQNATAFDALNRPISQALPDTTVIVPTYNRAGSLETVRVNNDLYVKELDYDAKGQRQFIVYGNGVRTDYTYDPLSYRLTGLVTLRGSERLQDLSYTYDPAGNITEVRDTAQQTAFFNGQLVAPTARYTYDAIGRLMASNGREHASLVNQPDSGEPSFAPVPHPSNGAALRNYLQSYVYDEVGNIKQMRHEAGIGSWTRSYDIALDSNRLLSHSVPGVQAVPFTYDEHGNMTKMPHLAGLAWDTADRLHMVDLGGGGRAFYTYDGWGQRVRKVLLREGGLVEQRVYLGGYEEHRRILNGQLVFQRNTVHVMDDTRRIALIETEVTATPSAAVRVRYQLGNHLGSCSLELSQLAEIVSYEEYHPYGTTSLWLGSNGVEAKDRRYRYTGKEKDEETGLYYHGARHYAPWLGRWTAPDPAGISDGVNRFRYVACNPIILVDPTGNQSAKPEWIEHERADPTPGERLSEERNTGAMRRDTPSYKEAVADPNNPYKPTFKGTFKSPQVVVQSIQFADDPLVARPPQQKARPAPQPAPKPDPKPDTKPAEPAIESGTAIPAPAGDGDPEGITDAERSEFFDDMQTFLDVVGFVPVLGDFVDVANAGISLARGKPGEAAIGLGAAIPFFGMAAGAAKIATRATGRAAKAAAKAADLLSEVTKRLQAATDKVNKAFAANPSLAMLPGVLSKSEIEGMISKFGKEAGFNKLYGHAIERLVAKEVASDPFLSKYIRYVSNIQQTVGGTGDFAGIGTLVAKFDITTPGQALRKMQSTANDYIYITYTRLFNHP